MATTHVAIAYTQALNERTDLDPGEELERVAVHEGANVDGAALGLFAVEGEAVDEQGESRAGGRGCLVEGVQGFGVSE